MVNIMLSAGIKKYIYSINKDSDTNQLIKDMANTKEFIKELSVKHGTERKSLIPILQDIVQQESYLSSESMIEVARLLDISAAEVYGTASFFSFLDTEARGKFKIRVCKSITCDMKGKNEIIKTIENIVKIKVGETTRDSKFSLLETNCLGWCHKGPAMLINDEVYTELTPERIRDILGEYIRDRK